MALIRCYGKIRLPKAYRDFLRVENEIYRKLRREGGGYLDTWWQDYIEPNSVRELYREGSFDWKLHFTKSHYLKGDDDPLVNPLPTRCQAFEDRLSEIFVGRQFHTVMTTVTTPMHRDNFSDQIETAIVIPYMVSPQHRLVVEDEERVLLPNHIYAFNQWREHKLAYGSDGEDGTTRSRPASLLSIGFSRTERHKLK